MLPSFWHSSHPVVYIDALLHAIACMGHEVVSWSEYKCKKDSTYHPDAEEVPQTFKTFKIVSSYLLKTGLGCIE